MSSVSGYTAAYLYYFHMSRLFSSVWWFSWCWVQTFCQQMLSYFSCLDHSHFSNPFTISGGTTTTASLCLCFWRYCPTQISNWLLCFSTLWQFFKHSLLLQEVATPMESLYHMSPSLWNHSKCVLPPSLSTHKKIKTNCQSNGWLFFFPLSPTAVRMEDWRCADLA